MIIIDSTVPCFAAAAEEVTIKQPLSPPPRCVICIYVQAFFFPPQFHTSVFGVFGVSAVLAVFQCVPVCFTSDDETLAAH